MLVLGMSCRNLYELLHRGRLLNLDPAVQGTFDDKRLKVLLRSGHPTSIRGMYLQKPAMCHVRELSQVALA